jgi:GT2 family glycosyltransferase
VGPEISVVIPTRERETRLAFALEALEQQTLGRDRFEVVVVRDGDWERPRAEAPPGIDVRFLLLAERRGPAAARNLGWREARAPLVAFCDDDCRPAPEWLEELLVADEGPDTFLQGRTEPDPDERHLLGGLARTMFVDAPNDWFQACNIAYPRALLERLGGFDERFPGPAGEDTDLALRAREAGARAVWVSDALVWHAVHPRHLPRALAETLRWDVVPAVVARHPAQREALRRRVFWKESHERLALAAAGLLTRRRVLVLAAFAPYVELHLRGYDRTPRGLARAALDLPARVAVDAAEVAVTVRGSMRHGVPVV